MHLWGTGWQPPGAAVRERRFIRASRPAPAACRGAVLLLFVAAATASTGCRQRETTGGDRGAVASLRFDLDRGVELTLEFADLSGRFRRVTGAAGVPSSSQKQVVLTAKGLPDPGAGHVYVADLTARDSRGEVKLVRVERRIFEARAVAALPPGAGSRVRLPALEGTFELGPASDDVIVYGASWCGACRELREHLRERRVRFREVDIEADPEAARSLARHAAALGIAVDRVPAIAVGHHLIVGFDRERLKNLLGEDV